MKMPNFFMVGAPKAGTTSLFHYLHQHPQVFMSRVKEPSYFAPEARRRVHGEDNEVSLSDYLALFDEVANEPVIGEATTAYLANPHAPDRIHSHVPEAKILAILRDPAERFYSHYMMEVRDNQQPCDDFYELIENPELLKSNRFLRDSIDYGFYYRHIPRYYEKFAPNQVKICLYDDLQADPQELLRSIFQFLEVDESFVPDVSVNYNTSGVPRSRLYYSWITLKPVHRFLRRRPGGRAPKHQGFHAFGGIQLVNFDSRKSLMGRLGLGALVRRLIKLRNRALVKPPQPTRARKKLVSIYRDDILHLQDLIQRDLSSWLR